MLWSSVFLFCFVLFCFFLQHGLFRVQNWGGRGGGGLEGEGRGWGVGQVILLRDYQHLFLNRRFDGRPASKD